MTLKRDIAYLQMAYGLAEKAKGWASPNPYVGAVIVKRNVIVGYGFHKKPGTPHAEVIALQKAGILAKNGTAYITLEPCTHWGRTPPCVDCIQKAGLKRIVISSLDPNPLVYKKGVKKLRQAGMDLDVGLLNEKNKRLNETYIKYVTQKIPFVLAKAAVSLDGKIATKKYSSRWISSPQVRNYTHLLRGEYDALMVGINTIIKDDPLLTVRHSNWRGKRLIRVIIDSKLRFPLQSKILTSLAKGEILIFTLNQSSQKKAAILRKHGVEVIALPSSSSKIDLNEVLCHLGQREISSVMVEGGGSLFTSLLEQRLVDKIFLAIAPKLIGGKDAPSFFQGKGVDFIKDSLQLKKIKMHSMADDTIMEGYF